MPRKSKKSAHDAEDHGDRMSFSATGPCHQLFQHALAVSNETGMCVLCLITELHEVAEELVRRKIIDHGDNITHAVIVPDDEKGTVQ